eukprot:2165695-Rhodomonas_salina.1
MEQLSDHGKVRCSSGSWLKCSSSCVLDSPTCASQITRTRELRHLVRSGVPENLRGKLWLAIVDCSSVRSQYHARYYEELLSGSAFQVGSATCSFDARCC